MRRCASGTGNADAGFNPNGVTKDDTSPTRASAQIIKCRSPTPARAQEKQQKICEIKLLFDRQRPENSVDAVTGVRVEIVKHQQMHHDVVNKKVRDVDAGGQCGHHT